MPQDQFWESIEGPDLQQGDYLSNCLVPLHPADLRLAGPGEVTEVEFDVPEMDLIVLSQSCDLAHDQEPIKSVLLCPIYPKTMFLKTNPAFANANRWAQLEEQRINGLCWLPPIEQAFHDGEPLIVNYRETLSLGYDYLRGHAEELGARWRLDYPYLHQFSDAFGRLFSRPALPEPPSVIERKAKQAEEQARKQEIAEQRAKESAERKAQYMQTTSVSRDL